MKAYPEELRIRIVQAVELGIPRAEVAALFAVGRQSVSRYVTQHRQGHDLTPGQSSGRPRTIGPEHAAALRAQVAAHADATLADHCTLWARAQGVRVSIATMSRAIQRLAITVKKNPVRGGTR